MHLLSQQPPAVAGGPVNLRSAHSRQRPCLPLGARPRKASVAPTAQPSEADEAAAEPQAVEAPAPAAAKRKGRPRATSKVADQVPTLDASSEPEAKPARRTRMTKAKAAEAGEEPAPEPQLISSGRGSTRAARRRKESEAPKPQQGDKIMQGVMEKTVVYDEAGVPSVNRAALGEGKEHWWSISVSHT